MTGTERRNFIVRLLKKEKTPYTGSELAKLTKVSRQVVVTDIALLRTADEPIIATNKGYMYVNDVENDVFRKVIACKHVKEDTKKELFTIVDQGVKIIDVIVEHPIYGEIKGNLQIESRYDAEKFVKAINEAEASLLLQLTEGIHLHTLEADDEEKLHAAIHALRNEQILYEVKEDENS